jgi:adenylate kinase
MKRNSKTPLSIILFGRAGSGKGTQADLLAKKFKLEHFSSGEALRQRQKVGDFTGKKLAEVMNRGEWVPPSIVCKVWMDKLEEFKKKRNFKGWVYDGGPRFMLEAKLLDIALIWYEWEKNTKFILVDISKKIAFDRLTKRRQCKKCGELIPWLGDFKNLKKCHKCKGELIFRPDDKPSAIRKRLQEFEEHIVPVINYYKKQKRVIKINGEQSIENVFKEILKNIK